MTKREILGQRQTPASRGTDRLGVELWDLVEFREEEFEFAGEQKAELDRRVAEAEANPQAAEDCESLKARLLRGDLWMFEKRRISLSSEVRRDLRETFDCYEAAQSGVGRS